MKAEEIRSLDDSELTARIAEFEEERFRLKFRSASEALEEPLRLRSIRKDIARLQTVRRERALGDHAFDRSRTEGGREGASEEGGRQEGGSEEGHQGQRPLTGGPSPHGRHTERDGRLATGRRSRPHRAEIAHRVGCERQDGEDGGSAHRPAHAASAVWEDGDADASPESARRGELGEGGRHRAHHGDPAAVEGQAVACGRNR